MHFPLDYQDTFMKSPARASKEPEYFNPSLLNTFHRRRCSVEKTLNTRAPAACHVAPVDLDILLQGSGLTEPSLRSVFPLDNETVLSDC